MCELLQRFIRACQNGNFKQGLFRNFAQMAFSDSVIVRQYEDIWCRANCFILVPYLLYITNVILFSIVLVEHERI